jgi:hypothetical protein
MKSKDQILLEEAYGSINKESASGVSPETEKLYWDGLEKVNKGEITLQQWYDICTKLLGDIMEANKDVFVRLKNR